MTLAAFPLPPRRYPWLYLTGAVVVIGLAGYLVPGLSAARLTWYNDDFAYVLIGIILAVASARRSLRATGLEERRMWRLLAIAVALWGTADLGESLVPALKQQDLAGLPSTLVYALAYGAWLFATVEAPHRRSGWTTDQPGWTLERWGVAVFAVGVVADLIIIPQLVVPGSPLPSGLSSALFMAFDLAFLARLAGLRARTDSPVWLRWYGVMTLVAFMMFACDTAATLTLFQVVGGWEGPWYDLFWYAPMLVMGYACSLPTPQPEHYIKPARSFAERASADGSRSLESCLAILTPAFVFIHLVVGLTPAVPAAAADWRDVAAIATLAVLGYLLLQRQAGLERQVHRLGHELHEAMETLADRRRLDSIARLAGGVAHNFNNLLTVILGHGELLRGRLGPLGEATEDVGRIEEAAQRAARLTADLLAFGAQQAIEPRAVHVNDLVDDTLVELRGAAGPGLNLNTHRAGQIPAILADPALMRVALRHLVDHARHRLNGTGSVTLTTAPLVFAAGAHPRSLIPAGTYVRLSVEDDGPPLGPDEQEQLFEPFSGPGADQLRLGLAAVRGIVQRHHGYILVHAGSEQGLRFDLLFPCAGQPVLS